MTLTARLAELVADPGTLVVGVGNRLRGDDAVGPIVAEELREVLGDRAIDAGTVPESFLGPLMAGRTVVFVDAVAHGETPGGWCLVPAAHLAAAEPTTHHASLQLLANLLEVHGITSWVVGIEPETVTLGAPLSPPVARAACEVAAALGGAGGDA